jgi:type IV pilus secretin PilQ/predicted competence protein
MKRSLLLILAATLAVLGLVWGPVLHGNTKASAVSAKKEIANAQPSRTVNQAAAVPSGGEPLLSQLTGISIHTAAEGGETTIVVSTSRRTDYRVMRMDHPDRLVLDLEGAQNVTKRWRYTSHQSPLLERVRVGRFSSKYGGIIRVVADLRGDPAYSVDRQAAGFRIELTSKDIGAKGKSPKPVHARVASKKPAVAAVPKAVAKVAETTPKPIVKKKEKKTTVRKPETVAVAHVPPPVSVENAAVPQKPAKPTAKPKTQPQPRKEKEYPDAVHAAKAAKVVATAHEADLSRTAISVKEPEVIQNGPQYTGKRISLNLKDVDLKDFFRLIHEVSGLNIIVDPDVSGSVTIVLDDVPWDQALALVLNNNGLGDRLEGNVLRIAKISTLTREQEDERKLAIAREDSAPLVTVFRQLNYAKATALAALLKTWGGGGALSPRGTVLVDERSNTLVITDVGAHISKIESVINKLDRKAQQVSIQARIIRATSDFARNLSTALSFAQRNGSGSIVTGGATGNPVSGEPLTPPSVTTSPATGFGVFVLSNLGRNYAINAAIAAAETHDQAKTISQPSIVTQNNVEGTVIQGTQIPIQTTINNTISVQYVQASLQLKVTPQVTQDGNVFLTIDVENSTPGPALTLAGPTINTQSATTQVLVPNGGTVVFGGVTVHTKSNSSTGIPLLEDIPILGHLFKSTTTQRNDQELLFFVTPKILI